MLPLKLMRDIIEKIYEAETRYDCSMRDMSKMMHTKYGLSQKYFLAQALKLHELHGPELINDDHHLTLRRAANKLLNIHKIKEKDEKETRNYTNRELGYVVVSVGALHPLFRGPFPPVPKSKRLTRLVALAVRDNHPRNQLLRKYDIPPQSFKRHRRLYEAWLAEKPGRGHKHSARRHNQALQYFDKIKGRGRPPFLDETTEQFVAEYIAGWAKVTVNPYDKRRLSQVLARVAVAMGTSTNASGSRSHVRGFKQRAKVLAKDGTMKPLKEQKATNISAKRCEALDPKKFIEMFKKASALFKQHMLEGRCDNVTGHPSAEQVLNTDEWHPDHGHYNSCFSGPDTDRLMRKVDGERMKYATNRQSQLGLSCSSDLARRQVPQLRRRHRRCYGRAGARAVRRRGAGLRRRHRARAPDRGAADRALPTLLRHHGVWRHGFPVVPAPGQAAGLAPRQEQLG